MHNKQQALLRFLSEASPSGLSYPQLGKEIKEPVRQKVWYYVVQLQKKGLARIDPSTKLVYRAQADSKDPIVAIPLYGAASCGKADAFTEDRAVGHLRLSKRLLDRGIGNSLKRLVAVEAMGDSMNRAKIGKDKLPINSGDYVLVDTGDTELDYGSPKYVASIIAGMANIKKAILQQHRIELLSESSSHHHPILIHEEDGYMIAGRVVQVIPKSI